MKNSMRKMILAGVFACAFATTAIGVANLNVAADGTVTVTTNENVKMVQSGSLRVEKEVDGDTVPFGLRFKTLINKNWYDSYVAEGITPQVYTVLLPTNKLNGAVLTKDTVGAVTSEDEAAKKYDKTETDGSVINYCFNTVLKEIPKNNYSTEITARSYIVVGNDTYYSDTVARSVVAVASYALEADATLYGDVGKYLVTGVNVIDKIQVGAAVDLSLSCATGTSQEAIGILNDNIDVEQTSGEEYVTYEAGKLTAKGVGEATFTVSTFGFSQDITVKAHNESYGSSILETATNVQPYSNDYTSDVKVVTDEETGKKVIQFTASSSTAGTIGTIRSGVLIDCPDWVKEVADKAYVNLTMKVIEQGSGSGKRGWIIESPNLYDGQNQITTALANFDGQLSATPKPNCQQELTVPVNLSNLLTEDGKQLELTVVHAHNSANTTTGKIQITDIEFCFGKVLYSNSTFEANSGVNVFDHLGLKEGEIAEATFGGVDVMSDLTAFKPTQNGKLKLKIQKEGYVDEYDAEVEVMVIDSLTYTDTAINLNEKLNLHNDYYRLYFTPQNGETTLISGGANKKSFVPSASGVIKVEVLGTVTGGIMQGTIIYIDVAVESAS